jgi:hypothetical protein
MDPGRRHPRFVRLLKHTAAAFVLASAFADAAQADFGSLTAHAGPVAPLTSTPAGVSSTAAGAASTATGVLDTTTATTNQTLGTVQSTASEAQSTVATTVNDTVATVRETVDGITPTTNTVEQTIDQVLASTGSTIRSAPAAIAGAPGDGHSLAVASCLPVITRPAKPAHVRVQGQRASSAPVVDAPQALPPAYLRHTPSALQAPSRPGRDLPGGPFSLPAMLLGGSGDGVSVVTGVLTTLLTIWLLNAPGGRLRVVADVLRPPDVFFRLERPG